MNTESKTKAHIITLGNEKGGTGKTTLSMHIIASLLKMGFKVGSMDVDSRQKSLSRYIENRHKSIIEEDLPLSTPHHIIINKSLLNNMDEAQEDESERFAKGLGKIVFSNDFVVIDCPGNDTYLSRTAHSFADTIITPMNDSFIDLDLIAKIDGNDLSIIKPSIYSEMIWEQKLQKAKRDTGSINWFVVRNRMSNIVAKNKQNIARTLDKLSERLGFKVIPGMGERVIFRELFLKGLTVMDIMDITSSVNVSVSHIAARQEIRNLLKALNIEKVNNRLSQLPTNRDEEKEINRTKIKQKVGA